jgi:hypothetical protein
METKELKRSLSSTDHEQRLRKALQSELRTYQLDLPEVVSILTGYARLPHVLDINLKHTGVHWEFSIQKFDPLEPTGFLPVTNSMILPMKLEIICMCTCYQYLYVFTAQVNYRLNLEKVSSVWESIPHFTAQSCVVHRGKVVVISHRKNQFELGVYHPTHNTWQSIILPSPEGEFIKCAFIHNHTLWMASMDLNVYSLRITFIDFHSGKISTPSKKHKIKSHSKKMWRCCFNPYIYESGFVYTSCDSGSVEMFSVQTKQWVEDKQINHNMHLKEPVWILDANTPLYLHFELDYVSRQRLPRICSPSATLLSFPPIQLDGRNYFVSI